MKPDKWLKNIQCVVYPPRCVFCDDAGQMKSGEAWDLCAACESDLVPNSPACPSCAEPMVVEGLCPACLRKPPPQVYTWAPFQYRFPLNRLVSAFKFDAKLHYGRLMAQLFTQALGESRLSGVDCVVPVPLHPARLRERGFNQAQVLCENLAPQGVEVDVSSVRRIRATEAQSTLDRKARRRNIRGAFSCERDFSGKRVAIVDDVMTSGSTVNELSRLLIYCGATEVVVWVFARAPMANRRKR